MRKAAPDQFWRKASAALLALAGLVMLLTFRHYGASWDEDHSALNGSLAWKFYESDFKDQSLMTTWNLHLYGSFFNLLIQAASRVLPFRFYDTAHLLGAFAGWLGFLGAYRLGQRLGGARAGFLSALALVLTPPFYGHAFFNPKDVPLATLFLWSCGLLIELFDALPVLPSKQVLTAGVVIGLTLGTRIAGIVLFPYLMALIVLYWAIERRFLSASAWRARLQAQLRPQLGAVALLTAVAWGVMCVTWPYALLNPLTNPLQALSENSRFDWPFEVFFDGRFTLAKDLPRGYLPTWFAISLPEFYFIGLLAAAALLFRGGKTRADLQRQGKAAFLAFAACFPVASAVFLHATVYDGMRHFLFVVPLLAVLAGWGLSELLSSARRPALRNAALGAAALSGLWVAVEMIRLHPYQYIYFNRLFGGGLAQASGKYETEYWSTSYQEGIDWLVANYRPATGERIRVANTSIPFLTTYALEGSEEGRTRFSSVGMDGDPHVILSTTRWNRHQRPGRVLHVVEREGVPLTYVIEAKAP